jgi:hypothetical protein
MEIRDGDLVMYVKHESKFKTSDPYTFTIGKIYLANDIYQSTSFIILNNLDDKYVGICRKNQVVPAIHDNKLNRTLYPDYIPHNGFLVVV